MNQAAVLTDMVYLYAIIAAWLIAVWTKGTRMDPTPAARRLLQLCREDYNDPAAVICRAGMPARERAAEANRLHRNSTYGKNKHRSVGLDILRPDETP